MTSNPNTVKLMVALEDLGLKGFQVQREVYAAEHFGDGEVVFAEGDVVLRFVFDRGQEFLDVAGAPDFERFYQFDDVCAALEWPTTESVLGRRRPEPLSSVVERLSEHIADLRLAFSRERRSDTHQRLREAEAARGRAFAAWLESRPQHDDNP